MPATTPDTSAEPGRYYVSLDGAARAVFQMVGQGNVIGRARRVWLRSSAEQPWIEGILANVRRVDRVNVYDVVSFDGPRDLGFSSSAA